MKLEAALDIGGIYGKKTVEEAFQKSIAKVSSSSFEIDDEIGELMTEWNLVKKQTAFRGQSSCDDVSKWCSLKKLTQEKVKGYLFEITPMEREGKIIAMGSVSEMTRILKERVQKNVNAIELNLHLIHKGETLKVSTSFMEMSVSIHDKEYMQFIDHMEKNNRCDMLVLREELEKVNEDWRSKREQWREECLEAFNDDEQKKFEEEMLLEECLEDSYKFKECEEEFRFYKKAYESLSSIIDQEEDKLEMESELGMQNIRRSVKGRSI